MRRRVSTSAVVTACVAVALSAVPLSAVRAGAASPPGGGATVGITGTPSGRGYWLVNADGSVHPHGDAEMFGAASSLPLNGPIVGMAATPDGMGYWLVASDGGVFAYGDAGYFGSARTLRLNAPIVGMDSTADGAGYWLVASDGGVFAYGDAGFFGSAGALPLRAPVVGLSASRAGGYWLVASDGGVFAYGGAGFFGSAADLRLNAPVAAIHASADGGGYWLAGSDGGIFTYGNAGFFGSAAGLALNEHVVGLDVTPDGGGYWMVASDGGVFNYGDAPFHGTGAKVLALYGDSLGMESAQAFRYLAAISGASTLLRAAYSKAICDEIPAMASDAATLHPSVAVIEFTGNAVTPCMSGYTVGTTAYYDKYASDAQAAIDIFRSRAIPVVLIGPPISAWANLAANLDFLNQIYRSLAAANPGVTFSDAGQSVLDNGEFTLTLPCLTFEPCIGPDGTNVVRSPDGNHFCPSGHTTFDGPYALCDTYSSGAFRFALAMLAATSGL